MHTAQWNPDGSFAIVECDVKTVPPPGTVFVIYDEKVLTVLPTDKLSDVQTKPGVIEVKHGN